MKVIKEITSRDNGIFKLIRSLKMRKNRTREALFVVEGPKQVIEALNGRCPIRYIIIRNEATNTILRSTLINDSDYSKPDFEIKSKSSKVNIKDDVESFVEFSRLPEDAEVILMDPRLFKELSDTEKDQGILAVVKKEELSTKDFIRIVGPGSNILALDRVQDPGNLGTLIRTAEGAGFKGVVTLKGTGDPYSQKAVRAAGGAILRMPHVFFENPQQLRDMADISGKIIATTKVNDGTPYYQVNLTENVILVMGNEGKGVSKEMEVLSEISLNIPTEGDLESLNVATAGAILMMDSLRQKRLAKI